MAVLDVGSSKTGCLIVETGDGDNPAFCLLNARVLGVGYQRSQGLKGGVVLDATAVEMSIRSAVDKAERQAGFSIDEVTVCLNAGRFHSQNCGAVLDIGGAKVKNSHVEAVLRQGWEQVSKAPYAILHAQPVGFAIDGVARMDNPAGFPGQRLFADFHVLGGEYQHVRRLLGCVEDSYLTPRSVVVAPYASALASLRQREINEGAAIIDLGGGTSSLAVFSGGHFVFASSLAKGGIAVSAALAKTFGISWKEAERIKLLVGRKRQQGSAWPKGVELIRKQYASIFLHQKKKMMDSGFALDAAKYVVLAGGGALFFDAARIAADIFDKPVRIGSPATVQGMPSQLVNPAFAALWGGVAYKYEEHRELASRFCSSSGYVKGSFSRLGSWFQRLAGQERHW